MEGNSTSDDEVRTEFKMPIYIAGKVEKLFKKTLNLKQKSEENNEESKPQNESLLSNNSLSPAVLLKEMSTPIPYKEPKWSGLCPDGSDYALEVLKSGVIIERIELTKKPYYVFGRLANCDIVMAHPTMSRHHSVLQYKAFAEEGEPNSGWYLYDLGSTHGTYLNKAKIKPNHYTRVRVGHQIKFGTSTRTYILLGPEFDCEGESELTVTEIKQKALSMKMEKQRIIKEIIYSKEREKAEEEMKLEETGIDWGLGEDAEEETDLADNPYASTANEELYLDDPKKTLRGYFEREGEELQYDCEERGVGQFICRVVLPLDDPSGRPVTAEVAHRGKKKDAVVACALEACRILDRAGLLRQAKHEPRRRKARDWSADDFYDSDEDSYLDRTGTVERKRKRRMIKHGAAQDDDVISIKPLTYEDLLEQVAELESKIAIEEKGLETLRSSTEQSKDPNWEDVDDLEQFMLNLGSQKQSMSRKAEISNAKMNIKKLQVELAKTQKLAEITRPAHMPPLIKKNDKKALVKVTSHSVVYGKRIKLKHDEEKKHEVERSIVSEQKEEEKEFKEEMDSDEDELKLIAAEIKMGSQHITEEKSKQDASSVNETERNVEAELLVKEIKRFQDSVIQFTEIQRAATEREINYSIKESSKEKEHDKESKKIDKVRKESLEDKKVSEKRKNTEDGKNKKKSTEKEKRNSQKRINHNINESTKKGNGNELDAVDKKSTRDKKHKKESSSEKNKPMKNITHTSKETCTKKESANKFDGEKKDKAKEKYRRKKSSEGLETEVKTLHKSKESSTECQNKKEVASEKQKNVKDEHKPKEFSESLKTTEKDRHKEKKSSKKESNKEGDGKQRHKEEKFSKKEGDDMLKHRSEYNNKETSKKSNEKVLTTYSTKTESIKNIVEKNTEKSEDKHKHSSKKESRMEDDVDDEEKCEDKYKRTEPTSEESKIERKRPHSVDKEETIEEKRKIMDGELKNESKEITSELESANEQNVEPKKEEVEIKSDSEENVDAIKEEVEEEDETTRIYGPMRPPADYVIPESYFEQCSDRDLPEITEEKIMDITNVLYSPSSL